MRSLTKTFAVQLLTIGSILAICSTQAEPVKYVTEDHLFPWKPEFDGALRPLLEAKLFITSADCGRMLDRPPENGELAVSVYSPQEPGSGEMYYVTLTEAEKNIDMAFNFAGGSIDEVNKIGVKRRDARIPESAALALRAAWKTMLTRVEKPHFYARSALHREELEFSLVEANTAQVLYGVLPDKGGKSIATLMRLGRLLTSYCKASVAEQPKLAKEIERTANRLVARLKSK
jgi:hypothetical protein